MIIAILIIAVVIFQTEGSSIAAKICVTVVSAMLLSYSIWLPALEKFTFSLLGM
jgi:hypothetical protein